VTKPPVAGLTGAMEDAEAIRRVLDGDVEAFSHLVGKYHGRCAGYARRMLRNRESAEDAVQETFLRAFRGLSGYDDRSRFAAWLFMILVNRCRSALKAEARRWDHTTLEDLPGDQTPRTNPGDRLAQAAVEAAVKRLPEDQREAFLLRHVEQLSYEEMNAVTGVGISALKMRVSRACLALREEFGHDR
jgi:RNA polymerase sigma-70 factor, ECF subfamily